MDHKVNYIKHFTAAIRFFQHEKNTTPTHIALYVALFTVWNENRFKNPFYVTKERLLKISAIKSRTTFYSAIKKLQLLNLVAYAYTHNRAAFSILEIPDLIPSKLNTSVQNLDSNSPFTDRISVQKMENDQIMDTSCSKIEHNPVQKLNSYNYKHINKQNKLYGDFSQNPPSIDFVIKYFIEKNIIEAEAHNFFNYYASIGWKIGGKTPIKNWNAAANKWIASIDKFKLTKPAVHNLDSLHTETNKNYEIPL
jgi:hypothetical protein